MSALFSKPKVAAVQFPTDTEAERNVREQARLRRFKSARASTIIGGADTLGQSPNLATKQLLGG